MYIHLEAKIYTHGKAVAPWLTPYGGAADMRGLNDANHVWHWSERQRSVRQRQICNEAQFHSAVYAP